MYKYKISFALVVLLFSTFEFFFVFATSSTDYQVDPEITYPSNVQSSSTDYKINCQQVGAITGGVSIDSSGNRITHGITCDSTDVLLDFIFSPQGRYGMPLSNDQTKVTIEVRPVGGGANSFIFSQEVTTNPAGSFTGLVLTGVSPGNYDVTAKGWATLRIKKLNVSLVAGTNSIDFTNAGTNKAKAGDVDLTDRSGVGSAEKGDNEINAADYSVLVGNYNLVGPMYDRYDLDQYGGGASAADYSLLVANYNLVGDL